MPLFQPPTKGLIRAVTSQRTLEYEFTYNPTTYTVKKSIELLKKSPLGAFGPKFGFLRVVGNTLTLVLLLDAKGEPTEGIEPDIAFFEFISTPDLDAFDPIEGVDAKVNTPEVTVVMGNAVYDVSVEDMELTVVRQTRQLVPIRAELALSLEIQAFGSEGRYPARLVADKFLVNRYEVGGATTLRA